MRWASDGDIAKTECAYESPAASSAAEAGNQWSGACVVTVPSPAEDLQIRLKTSTSTAYLHHWRLLAIRLDSDLTEGSDFYVDADDDIASPVNLTTTYADFATSTHAFAAGKWLFLSGAQVGVDSTINSYQIAYSASGGGITAETDVESFVAEGEDAAEIHNRSLIWRVFDLDGSSFTFKIRGSLDAGSDQAKHRHSEIVAINLDKFAETHDAYNESLHALAAASTWEETLGLTPFTPTVGGADWVLLASAKAGMNIGASYEQFGRIQLGGTTTPSSGDESDSITGHDSTDRHLLTRLSVEALAASSQDIDFDLQSENASYADWWRRGLLAWSLELADSNTVNIGIAPETDTALPMTIGGNQFVDLGIVSEVSSALTIVPGGDQIVDLGVAAETDSALAITVGGDQTVDIGLAQEVDSALPIVPGGPQTVDLGLAVEVDSALQVFGIGGIVVYPAVPKKTSVVPDSRTIVDASDSGAVRAVDLVDSVAYSIDISHPMIDAAQRDELIAFYEGNLGAVTSVTAADGRSYSVLINSAAEIEVVTPLRFNVRARLPGNQQ